LSAKCAVNDHYEIRQLIQAIWRMEAGLRTESSHFAAPAAVFIAFSRPAAAVSAGLAGAAQGSPPALPGPLEWRRIAALFRTPKLSALATQLRAAAIAVRITLG
jgi:hypothetical protein